MGEVGEQLNLQVKPPFWVLKKKTKLRPILTPNKRLLRT